MNEVDPVPGASEPIPANGLTSSPAPQSGVLRYRIHEPLEPPETVVTNPAATVDLEDRLRRLEEALTHLQTSRVEVHLPPPASSTNALIEVGKRILGVAESAPPMAIPVHAVPRGASDLRPRWLLFELVAELRVIFRMYVDPRYRLSWIGLVLPPVLLVLIASTGFWFFPFNSIPFVGWLFVKVMDLLLAYVLFKVLSHEARLYRQASPDLPASLRL